VKKILILGVNGFIGHHLSKRILADTDWHVYGMDMQSERVTDMLDHPRFHFFEGDITINKEWIEYHIRKCDTVLPLVAIATPATYVKEPLRVFELDFEANLPIVRQCVKYRKRILFPSTSEVYGDPTEHPQTESYRGNVNPIGPRACYDEGKRAAETLFFDYHRMNRVNIRVVRIFNTFGPRMHPFDGRVVSNFIRQAINNEDITLYGDGTQSRSFCFVEDLVEAIIRMMNGPDSFIGPVNIGNPVEYSMNQLAAMIIELTASKSKIIFKPMPADDPKQRQPDITLARKHLGGWEPKVPLREGLMRTIAYFKSLNLEHFRPPTPNY
jgi:UDP-glucuronate decarboxylase